MRPCAVVTHTGSEVFIRPLSLSLREHRECGGSQKEVHALRENRPRVSRSLVRTGCYDAVRSSTMSRGRVRSRDWRGSEWSGEDKRTLRRPRATLA